MILFPTAYLPSVSYVASFAREEAVVIERHETFPKQTLRNRAVIETANGRLPLVVPVTRPNGNHSRTGEMGISYAEHWNVQHWRAIESAYNASPFFLYYRDDFERILMQQHACLLDLNMALLRVVCQKLKISTEISLSTDFTKGDGGTWDKRGAFPIKGLREDIAFPPYEQVFSARHEFQPDLSIIDMLFNLGPEAREYLFSLEFKV